MTVPGSECIGGSTVTVLGGGMGKTVSFELDSVDDVVSEYQGLDAPGGNTVTVTGSVLDMLQVVELDGHPVAVTVAGP